MYITQYVYFNGNAIPIPNDLSMQIEDNIVSEIKTMSGKTLADVNGWKYSDITLEWDSLPEEYLQTMIKNTIGNFTFKFKNQDGDVTVNAFRRGRIMTQTRFRDSSNNIIWKDVKLNLSFPDCYS